MKTKLLLASVLLCSLSMAAYFTACKKDKAPDPEDAVMKPISVSFSREEILGLLSNTGANEVAGICFMPVQDGDRINLQAILTEWNTSENLPSKMVKVMDKSVMGKITEDICPALSAGGTSEFELVFFDKATLIRFLDNEYYYIDVTQKPEGIYFTRMMHELNYKGEYRKYRGLQMKPFPVPVLIKGYRERQSIGYEMGIPCPPIWRNGIQ